MATTKTSGEGAEMDAEVIALIRAGDKVGAVGKYFALHKCGLKVAKDAVDAWIAANPER